MHIGHVSSFRGRSRLSKAATACLAAGVVLIGTSLASLQTASAAPPAGFVDEVVADVESATALAMAPGDMMLVTTQPGTLRVIQNGKLLPAPALVLDDGVCPDNERGLLGVAVDPQYATNKYIYLYYTSKKGDGCANRLSRFTMTGATANPASEKILLDGLQSAASNHNGGDVKFGKDGFLYVSVGDSNQAGWAQDMSRLNGKILRITSAGGIPPSNPYVGADSARCTGTGATTGGKKCQEIFASGLRNPFRMAFDPNAADTKFYIDDVGQNTYEEIDLGAAGANYGWGVREGMCSASNTGDCGAPPAGMTNPIYAYGRDGGCASITGGAFVPGNVWGAAYKGAYLYSDYVCGKIFTLKGKTATTFEGGLGESSAVHMMFAPYGTTQALYYTSYANGGQVHRIRLNTATPSTTAAPTTAAPTTTPATTPPTTAPSDTPSTGAATITTPATSKTFSAGELVTLGATSTETLPDTSFEWSAVLHHNTHIHPWLPATKGKAATFAYPKPEDFTAATNSYIEVTLKVTGTDGTVTTVKRNILPTKVNLTFNSAPSGVTLLLNGTQVKTPTTVVSWAGYKFTVSAPATFGGAAFKSWTPGGANMSLTIATPAAAQTYVVAYGTGTVPAGSPTTNPGATITPIPVVTLGPTAATTPTTETPVTIPAPTPSTAKPAATLTPIPVVTLGPVATTAPPTTAKPTTTSTTTSTTSPPATTTTVAPKATTTTHKHLPPKSTTTTAPSKVFDPDADFVETPMIPDDDANSQPDALARTGISVVSQMSLGVLFICIGVLMIRARRSLEQE